MNNLVEILSGKHGNVTLMMNASERKKLARMRDFLSAEEEVYEKLDHYDIANMTDAELDGLLALSFDVDQIELPDDVEDLLDNLRRDIGEEEDPSLKGGGPGAFIGQCQRYGIAASLFVAVFASGYLLTSSDGNVSDLSYSPPPVEVGGFAPNDGSGAAMPNPSETPFSFPDTWNAPVSAAGLSFGSLSNTVVVSDATTASLAPNMGDVLISMIGALPEQFGIETAALPDQAAVFSADNISSSVQAQIQEDIETVGAGWTLAEGRGFDAEQFTGRVLSNLQQSLGEDLMTRGVIEGDSGNLIVQVDGLELHIFNFTLSEGESVYTIARETEVDPNIYSLIKRALEDGALVDTTTMALNDRIVGIASRQGDQYALSELVYDRARSSNMLVYSNCANLDQAVGFTSAGLNSEACMASAARMVTSASADFQ